MSKEPVALATDGRPLYTFDPHQRTEEDRRAAVALARDEILGELKRIRGLMEAALCMAPAAVTATPFPEGWESEAANLAEQIANLQAGSVVALPAGHQEWSIEIPQPAKAVWDALGRLTFLVGLSEGEARFVAEAAAKAASPGEAYDGLLVFADWLEDAMRPAHAEAVRRLVPDDGDVLVIGCGPGTLPPEWRAALEEQAREITAALQRAGRRVAWVTLPSGWHLDSLNRAALLGSGLVVKQDHDLLRQENEQLKAEMVRLQADLADAEKELAEFREWHARYGR